MRRQCLRPRIGRKHRGRGKSAPELRAAGVRREIRRPMRKVSIRGWIQLPSTQVFDGAMAIVGSMT